MTTFIAKSSFEPPVKRVVFSDKKIDVRFDPFDLSVVEVWHGGEKKLDAIPFVIGEFTNFSPARKTVTEVGRSRLLDIYVAENEKRKKNATGILRFGTQGGNADV